VGYVLDDLGVGRVVVGGYSMGGPVSQLLARERTDQVMGLVEMSTAAHLIPRQVFKSGLRVGMRFWDAGSWIGHQGWERWGGGGEQGGDGDENGGHEEIDEKLLSHAGWVVRHNNHRALTAAGHELSHYDAREWVGSLGIPVSCVITSKDHMVPRGAQLELAELTGAVVFEMGHGHGFCTHGEFGEAVVQACDSVLARVGNGGAEKAKTNQQSMR
jgi:3-oxoadipate enol-lactonase